MSTNFSSQLSLFVVDANHQCARSHCHSTVDVDHHVALEIALITALPISDVADLSALTTSSAGAS